MGWLGIADAGRAVRLISRKFLTFRAACLILINFDNSKRKDAIMAKNSSRGGSSKSSYSSKGVSAARLHQKSGTSNSFGGYTKVNKGGGNFAMKKTGGGK